MEDILVTVNRLHRPTLLVQTARHGLQDYCRTRHLRRVLKSDSLPRPGEAILRLLEIESHQDELRRAERAEYSFAGHIETLIALMCEARDLRAIRRARQRQTVN